MGSFLIGYMEVRYSLLYYVLLLVYSYVYISNFKTVLGSYFLLILIRLWIVLFTLQHIMDRVLFSGTHHD